jgi:hypothetical protein
VHPNPWSVLAWLAIAAALGSFVVVIGAVVVKAIFRRKRGWVLDSVLLGASGFVLVVAMMVSFLYTDGMPSQERKLLVGLVMVGVSLPLVALSRRLTRSRVMARSKDADAKPTSPGPGSTTGSSHTV